MTYFALVPETKWAADETLTYLLVATRYKKGTCRERERASVIWTFLITYPTNNNEQGTRHKTIRSHN
jgi:hypothetical protein